MAEMRHLRITGGLEADVGNFPSLVSLQTNDFKHFCGGSLISNRYILTAAHCLFKYRGGVFRRTRFQIMGGDISTSLTRRSSTRVYRRAALVFPHPKYNNVTKENDICVVKLAIEIASVDQIVYPIPMSRLIVKPHSFCWVAGWGHTEFGKPFMVEDLNKVLVTMFGWKRCKELYEDTFVMDTMMCAGYVRGGKDACQGDYGGGLFCEDTLVGIASSSYGCGSAYHPTIYMNVTAYRPWIEKCMKYEGTQADINVPLYVPSSAPPIHFAVWFFTYSVTVNTFSYFVLF